MGKSFQFLLIAGSFLCPSVLPAQLPPSLQASHEHAADRAAIGAVLQAQQSAWNRGDVDALLQGYWHSPELTFTGSGGVVRGWDGELAGYTKHDHSRAATVELDS